MNTQLVKSYLTLVRSPNLFTLPSNIFAGYFSVHTHNSIDIDTVVLLILVSASLYAAGVIFNDVADRKIDHKERHNRPIPSGKIIDRSRLFHICYDFHCRSITDRPNFPLRFCAKEFLFWSSSHG